MPMTPEGAAVCVSGSDDHMFENEKKSRGVELESDLQATIVYFQSLHDTQSYIS